MGRGCGCENGAGEEVHRPDSRLCRKREIAGCVLSAAMLVLLPKCPACVVGYVALLSGVGISFSAAKQLRFLMVGLCIAVIVSIASSMLLRHFVQRVRKGDVDAEG